MGKTPGSADRGDVDDAAAAVGGEVGLHGFHEQEGAADVDVVNVCEVVCVALFDGEVAGYAGVVDDDVDLEFFGFGVREVVGCDVDDVLGAVEGAHVGLDGEGFDAVALLELFA